MSVIVILILFSVLVASGFLAAFIWAVKTGQYDDTTSPAVRILNDDQIKNDKTGNSTVPGNLAYKMKKKETDDIPEANPE